MKQYEIEGDNLLIDVDDRIALVTLNRPKQHNALSRELRNILMSALRQLDADDDVGVIIFRSRVPATGPFPWAQT